MYKEAIRMITINFKDIYYLEYLATLVSWGRF